MDAVTLLQRILEGALRPVHGSGPSSVPHFGVDGVRKIEDGGSCGETERIAGRGEAEHGRCCPDFLGERREVFDQFPFRVREQSALLLPGVEPVRSHAALSEIIHDLRPDLDFDGEIQVRKDLVERRVNALVAVDLGDRDIILETFDARLEAIVQQIEDVETLLYGVALEDDPEREDVVERDGTQVPFLPELTGDAVDVLVPAGDGAGMARVLEEMPEASEHSHSEEMGGSPVP